MTQVNYYTKNCCKYFYVIIFIILFY